MAATQLTGNVLMNNLNNFLLGDEGDTLATVR